MPDHSTLTSTPPAPPDQREAATTGSRRRSPGIAWLAGAVAGLVGLAVSEVLGWLFSPQGSAVSAVGEGVIELLPGPLVNFGKETLRAADKPVLIGLITVVVLVVAGLAGRLEYRRSGLGLLPPLALTVVALVAINAQPDANAGAFLPTPVGLAVAYLVLRAMITKLRDSDELIGGRAVETRRRFLIMLGSVGVASVAVGIGGRALAAGRAAVQNARSMIKLPAAAKTAPPVPEGADLDVPGLTPYVTANETFYRIDTALQVPVVDPESWSLTITGMVQREVTISFEELLALPLVEHHVTLTCVSNQVGGNLAGNALWLGFPIRELLQRAGPMPGADMVLSRSVDNFTAGTPLEVLTDPERMAMVAVGMNGEPLPADHGFPARLVVPGLYGYVSATKWVEELKVTTFAQDQAYWTPLGWSARGPIKLASRIDTPTATVDAGRVAVAGVAWAQHTGISAVEVRVDRISDGGAPRRHPWQQARLADTIGPDTWRQWVYEWDAEPGEHELTVRAVDAEGFRQIAAEAPPAPNGATGYHSRTVSVR